MGYFKPPTFAIQSIFTRVVSSVERVKTSNVFLLKGKCPICGDYKQRMFCKEYPQKFLVYCHNCGLSLGFMNFLKIYFPTEVSLLNEYVLDSIRTGQAFSKEKKKKVSIKEKVDKREENDMKLDMYSRANSFSLVETQNNKIKEYCRNESIDYCVGRKLPKDVWSDFRFFYKGPLKGYIGIPMWSENKTYLLHIQGRLLFPDKNKIRPQKYLFLKDKDAGILHIAKPIYGLWKADPTKRVYINEGTLDAPAFGDQGVATCGATISDYFIRKIKKKFKNRVWCVDNFWKDEEGRKLTERLLLAGEACFIIPQSMKSKDSNSLLEEMNVDYLQKDFIDRNIYQGKLGLVKLKLQSM